jgi:hypothetical protein
LTPLGDFGEEVAYKKWTMRPQLTSDFEFVENNLETSSHNPGRPGSNKVAFYH